MEVVSILREKAGKMKFEETELRLGLGLPGNISSGIFNGNGKRGLPHETHDHHVSMDLKLNLVANSKQDIGDIEVLVINNLEKKKKNILPKEKNLLGGGESNDSVNKPPAKAQVVGWPPVRSYRKNIISLQKNSSTTSDVVDKEESDQKLNSPTAGGGSFVKVSLDGAPYLRKVDLKMYKTYQHLSDALGNMFSSFTIGNCGSQGFMDFMNESKLMDLLNSSDYVPTYEDKDGDWMLVGDVPWEMFVGNCKRLRIMKGAEAIGLAPRAVEKCKNRR